MRRSSMLRRSSLGLFLAVLLLSQWACSLSAAPAPPTPTPTLTPTPSPTSTHTPSPTPTLTPTLTPTATVDYEATQHAKASATMDARMADIGPRLKELGFDPQSGSLAWYGDKPISLSVRSYNSFNPEVIIEEPIADFILHTGIVWDSTSGLAGCGIIFRSEDDLQDGAKYQLEILRLQNAPAWGMYYVKFNTLQAEMGFDFTNYINDGKDSKNTIDLIAQGGTFTVYINGEKIRTVENAKLQTGRIAVMAYQESGTTVCTFDDGWVWELQSTGE